MNPNELWTWLSREKRKTLYWKEENSQLLCRSRLEHSCETGFVLMNKRISSMVKKKLKKLKARQIDLMEKS